MLSESPESLGCTVLQKALAMLQRVIVDSRSRNIDSEKSRFPISAAKSCLKRVIVERSGMIGTVFVDGS